MILRQINVSLNSFKTIFKFVQKFYGKTFSVKNVLEILLKKYHHDNFYNPFFTQAKAEVRQIEPVEYLSVFIIFAVKDLPSL